MSPAFGIILAVVIVIGIIVVLRNKSKKWYKVFTANNDVLCVYRTQKDYWIGDNIKDMITAHYEDSRVVYIPKHWIIKVERIQEADVSAVQLEIKNIHDKLQEEEKEKI
jgi:hypothetical protein